MTEDRAFTIRPFSPTDQTAARSIILAGLGEHFGCIDETMNPDLDDIWQYYVLPGHSFVVVEIDRELVGTGALVSELVGNGRIVRMSVSPRYRRRGIGRAVVNHLLCQARNNAYTKVLLETNHDWHAAIRLYQSCGFRPYDRDTESIHMAYTLP